MRITEKAKKNLYNLSIRKRLAYSNMLMFLIPVAVTLVTAAFASVIAFFAFERFYLPRIGLTVRGIHEIGERYEADLKSFPMLVAILLVIMLAVLVLSIFLTNRFLLRFMFRHVEEPLELLTNGASKIGRGELDSRIRYDRNDEFRPVCEAFNEMGNRLRAAADRSAAEIERDYLELGGFSVSLCTDGESGLDEAKTGRYDFISA